MSTNIGEHVKAVRKLHPTWSFEQSWNHVIAAHPEFENSTVESNQVAAKLAPENEKEAREKAEHIEVIARRLMARDRNLTFGVALQRVRLCLPAVQAEIANLVRQSVKAVEPKKGRTLLIRGSEATYVD